MGTFQRGGGCFQIGDLSEKIFGGGRGGRKGPRTLSLGGSNVKTRKTAAKISYNNIRSSSFPCLLTSTYTKAKQGEMLTIHT
jgi:hypothetical protein